MSANVFAAFCRSALKACVPSCRVGAALLGSLALSACGNLGKMTDSMATMISPYRMEVVQGNFISREQVEAVKPGMSKGQVRDILGTSLLSSIFHSNRWDYVFTMHRQGVPDQTRKLSVFFKDDVLERVEGDPMPSEAEFVATLESDRKLGKVPKLEADPESLKKFAPAAPPAAPTAAAPAPAEAYPPLESGPR